MTEHIVHIDDIEELVISKYFIEQHLLKTKEITEKYSLENFIQQFVKMTDNIVIFGLDGDVSIVSFYIYKYDNEVYVFFSENNENTDATYSFLKKIGFDLSSLKPYSGGNTMLRIKNKEYAFI